MIDPVTKKPAWKHEIIDIDGFACVGQPVQPKQVFLLTPFMVNCVLNIFKRQVLINKIMPTVPAVVVTPGVPAAAAPLTEYRDVPIT